MTDISRIIEFLKVEKIQYYKDVDLKTKTWIRRGGVAQLWVQPSVLYEFEKLVSWCPLNDIQFEVIGNTSNCYFLKDYNPFLVISTLKLNHMKIERDTIICECGYNMSRFAKYCIKRGIAGFEGFIGLPGTVGGAAINNSGCFGSLVSDVVKSVEIICNSNKLLLNNDQMEYSHRDSSIKSNRINGVVLSVTFDIRNKEDPNALKKKGKEIIDLRRTIQEQDHLNLGSIYSVLEFKRQSFLLRFINYFAITLVSTLARNPEWKQKISTLVFLKLRGAGRFREYISPYGIRCFVWKDEGADSAFNEYLYFIKRHATKAVIEIDIKGEL